MAHTGIYATSTECIFKLGQGYDTINVTEDRINELCLQAESYINDLCREVFAINTAAFTALNAGKKYILSEAVSCYVGFYGAMHNQNGYKSLRMAENTINTNWARWVQTTSLLRDQKEVKYITK